LAFAEDRTSLRHFVLNERKFKRQDFYQYSNNTIIILFVKQYRNDNTAIHRSSAVSGGLALKSDVTLILTWEKSLTTSVAWRHGKTIVVYCELLDMLVANIWYQLMQIIWPIYLPSSSRIQLLVLVRATCSITWFQMCFTDLEQWCSQTCWLGWSQTRIPGFAHEFKQIFMKWRCFVTIRGGSRGGDWGDRPP